MATTTAPAAAASQIGPKEYTETYIQFSEVDKGGEKSTRVLPEKRVEAIEEEAKKENREVARLRAQTFTFHEAVNAEDFETLIPSEAERVNIFNRGYILKQQVLAKDMLGDEKEFQTIEGPYNLLTDAQQERERRKASPEDKATKALNAVLAEGGMEALEKVLAAYKANIASMQAGGQATAGAPSA